MHAAEQPESCQGICGSSCEVVESKSATCLSGKQRPVKCGRKAARAYAKQNQLHRRRVSTCSKPFTSDVDIRISVGCSSKPAPSPKWSPTCRRQPARQPCGFEGGASARAEGTTSCSRQRRGSAGSRLPTVPRQQRGRHRSWMRPNGHFTGFLVLDFLPSVRPSYNVSERRLPHGGFGSTGGSDAKGSVLGAPRVA